MGVFSGLVISTVGTLEHDDGQVKKWVQVNGGTWSPFVTRELTHLIAGKHAWKKNNKTIEKAEETGVWVVTFDWLEDSIAKKRKLAEKKYTWEAVSTQRKRRKQLKRLGEAADSTSTKVSSTRKPKVSKSFFFGTSTLAVPYKPFESASEDLQRRRAEREAAQAGVEDTVDGPASITNGEGSSHNLHATCSSRSQSSQVSPSSTTPYPPHELRPKPTAAVSHAKPSNLKDLYHYHRDQTGFDYSVTLARSNPMTNTFASYHLALLESHTKPHTYCTLARYTPPARPRNEASNPTPSAEDVATTASASNTHDMQVDPTIRLKALVAPPQSDSTKPHKSFLAPFNSSYDSAFLAFRHAFRDITLLAWEERFDTDKILQTARAQQHLVEPYLYKKPAKGLPMGLLPQLHGAYDIDDGYLRDQFKLPGVHEALGTTGSIGGRIERMRKEAEERMKKEMEVAGVEKVVRKRVNYDKPMFNGVMERPRDDGAHGPGVRRVKNWPCYD